MRYFQFIENALPATNLIAEHIDNRRPPPEKRMIVKQIATSAADIIPIIATVKRR